MNEKTMKEIDQHVRILGWLNIGLSLFSLIIGVFVFLIVAGAGALSGDAEAFAITSLIATFVGGIMLVLSLPGFVAGYGLLKRKQWGRILALIIGILNLMNFPFGTAVGVYTIWVLLPQEASEYFATPKTI